MAMEPQVLLDTVVLKSAIKAIRYPLKGSLLDRAVLRADKGRRVKPSICNALSCKPPNLNL